MRAVLTLLCLGLGCTVIVGACGGSSKTGGFDAPDSGGFGQGDGSGSSSSGSASSSGTGSSSGNLVGDGSAGDSGPTGDPTTCAGAASSHSYIGCDYWPTVTANNVWSIFDFAAVVANAGTATANITVSGPGNTNLTATVAPGQLTTIYLPWVAPLKGADTDVCGSATPLTGSVLAHGAAYHLVSTVPVTVYQFNALEYVGQGGPSGKSWASCPGTQVCPLYGVAVGCYSFSNDASLLLPSTAMSGNYRITGHSGWGAAQLGAVAAITATADGTTVNVKVSSTGQVLAGGGIPPTSAGGTVTLTLNAGDVVELVGGNTDTSDLSGSLVQANKPVQVITAMPCLDVPDGAPACDHIEEANFPAETLGTDYIVAQPPGPHGNAVGHEVRIYGNFDNTHLTYSPSAPAGCPTTINAGQVVDCGTPLGSVCQDPTLGTPTAPCGAGNIVSSDFEVKGDQAFAVGTFTQGASLVDPSAQAPNQQGDPDQSMAVAVAQYRTKYVFLAPTDYTNSYAIVIAPTGTNVSIDGATVTATPTAVGSSGFGVLRVKLGAGQNGAHVLQASNPVGLEVTGYGAYTSYTYPGGLDLKYIAPPPAN
jgi:hypothetical protein